MHPFESLVGTTLAYLWDPCFGTDFCLERNGTDFCLKRNRTNLFVTDPPISSGDELICSGDELIPSGDEFISSGDAIRHRAVSSTLRCVLGFS